MMLFFNFLFLKNLLLFTDFQDHFHINELKLLSVLQLFKQNCHKLIYSNNTFYYFQKN
jgi:hypothetical protein